MKGATSIQERLWELRKDKGLNLEELSKLTDISKSALGSYEKENVKEISAFRIEGFCSLFSFFAENSLKAAVRASASRPLKKTR